MEDVASEDEPGKKQKKEALKYVVKQLRFLKILKQENNKNQKRTRKKVGK